MIEAALTPRRIIIVLAVAGMVGLGIAAPLTSPALQELQSAYFGATLVGILALCVLLRTAPDGIEGLGISLLLGLFLLPYLARFHVRLFLWLHDRADLLLVMGGADDAHFRSPETLLTIYGAMIAALAGLASAMLIVGAGPVRESEASPAPGVDAEARAADQRRAVLWLAASLGALTAALHYALIGLGHVAPDLPLRLAGMLAVVRNGVVPSLALLVVWAAERARHRPHQVAAITILALHGLTGAILTSSRLELLMPLAILGILWLVTGRLTHRRAAVISMVSALFILALPVFSTYRNILVEAGAGAASGLLEAALAVVAGEADLAYWLGTYLAVSARINGVDELTRVVVWVGSEARGLLAQLWPEEPVTVIFTRDILGVSLAATAVSPSLLGYFYFKTASVLGVWAGVAAWSGGWCLLVRYVLSHGFRAATVSLVILTWVYLVVSMEGDLAALPALAVYPGVALVLNHWLAGPMVDAPVEA